MAPVAPQSSSSPLAGRSILVTGGTGSFGNAFVRRALAEGARRIVILSRDELKQSQMRAAISDSRCRWFIGDVAGEKADQRLDQAMRDVEIAVHTAALKRVEVAAENPWQAVQTNVIGSYNVLTSAIRCNVGRVLLLSTDKSASPNTFYGSTKQIAEGLFTQGNVLAAGTHTIAASTRYGNVATSRGSVFHAFREQAKRGMLTVTDRRMTRFWMNVDQAVDLVVLALREMRGGETFIPKIGSASVLTMAEAAAPGVPWREIGIRRGEKLHETLISEDESRDAIDCGDHFRIEPDRTWNDTVPALVFPSLPDGFSYRSDTNQHQLSASELRSLIGEIA